MKKYINSGVWTLIAIIVFAIGYAIYHNLKPDAERRTIAPKPATADANAVLRDSIVEYGTSLLGTPYVAAGCSKDGFDCSGFVFYVFGHFNIRVPRSSAEFKDFGQEVAIADARKGDILVFLSPTRNEIGHLGIVTHANGMQSDFIHSSSGKEMKVIVTSLANEGYRKRFVKVVRVL